MLVAIEASMLRPFRALRAWGEGFRAGIHGFWGEKNTGSGPGKRA